MKEKIDYKKIFDEAFRLNKLDELVEEAKKIQEKYSNKVEE